MKRPSKTAIVVWAASILIAVAVAHFGDEPQFYGIAALGGATGVAGAIRYYLISKK
jgi:hypothetical protein